MGTNYYLYREGPCQACGHQKEPLHIGKSSMGWCFSLHVIPEDGINDLDDWIPLFDGATIKDEYGDEIGVESMLSVIRERGKIRPEGWDAQSFSGYRDEAHFHESNHSERGPNGLLRSRIEPYHCVKHGAGTWDCIVGEFS